MVFSNFYCDLSAFLIAVVVLGRCYPLFQHSEALLIIIVVLQLLLLPLHHIFIGLALLISVEMV